MARKKSRRIVEWFEAADGTRSDSTIERDARKIPAKELVKGDVIVLRAGDVVPADVRLIEVHDLLVEESILTGESEASEKIIPFWQQKNQSVTRKIWLFQERLYNLVLQSVLL